VLNYLGQPLKGVAVNAYVPDNGPFGSCVYWPDDGSGDWPMVLTDSRGVAQFPLMAGWPGTFPCTIVFYAGNVQSPDFDMLTFWPESVTIEAPASVRSKPRQRFDVKVAFKVYGEPIYGLPAEVSIKAGTNGASSTLQVRKLSAPYDADTVTIPLMANAKSGVYTITITRGPVSKTITVDQR